MFSLSGKGVKLPAKSANVGITGEISHEPLRQQAKALGLPPSQHSFISHKHLQERSKGTTASTAPAAKSGSPHRCVRNAAVLSPPTSCSRRLRPRRSGACSPAASHWLRRAAPPCQSCPSLPARPERAYPVTTAEERKSRPPTPTANQQQPVSNRDGEGIRTTRGVSTREKRLREPLLSQGKSQVVWARP
ncbi:hypothetical protein SKAU_G00175590 [Synaphobranchus kaupii]|uniref:Uncharacterized protein n=1 Tax=Synaphobranchus kaupii TaxID=118154 RepID=A0A9Q1IZ10_SYNKA|nr:hypothetical protein SKAU_G00175590 [Synaphobranchus kaupii]